MVMMRMMRVVLREKEGAMDFGLTAAIPAKGPVASTPWLSDFGYNYEF